MAKKAAKKAAKKPTLTTTADVVARSPGGVNVPLYEIDQDITDLLDEIAEHHDKLGNGDLESAEAQQTLEDIHTAENALRTLLESSKGKCDGIARAYFALMGRVDATAAEIKRLQHRKRMAQNSADRIINYMQYILMKHGRVAQLEGDVFKWSLRQLPPSVEVVDLNQLPSDWMRSKGYEPDVAGIKKSMMDTLCKWVPLLEAAYRRLQAGEVSDEPEDQLLHADIIERLIDPETGTIPKERFGELYQALYLAGGIGRIPGVVLYTNKVRAQVR